MKLFHHTMNSLLAGLLGGAYVLAVLPLDEPAVLALLFGAGFLCGFLAWMALAERRSLLALHGWFWGTVLGLMAGQLLGIFAKESGVPISPEFCLRLGMGLGAPGGLTFGTLWARRLDNRRPRPSLPQPAAPAAPSEPWLQPGAVRRDCEPHRAGLLRTLALSGYALNLLGCAIIPALLGLPLSLLAFHLARRDQAAMTAGCMDPSGFEAVENARQTAFAGVVFAVVWLTATFSCIGVVLLYPLNR